MAAISRKDKLVEEAQKLVMRGQFDKAAKVYEQVLALEPSAISHRQKLAEIFIKAGLYDDARKEFETIGKYFSNNGFYLKAIAVYKQLQKLSPADITISLTLAGLNEKHGLTANALSEYKYVYDYYIKAGNEGEALKILDNMQVVDPRNIAVKIKLAEAYFQHGKKDEAYATFVNTASFMLDRGDNSGVSKLNARIIQMFPDKSEFMLDVLAAQVMSGNAASAVSGLKELVRSNPKEKRVWDLIVEAYRRLGQSQKLKVVYQHYHKMLPDEPAPMSGLLFCSVAERDVDGALELLELWIKNLLAAGFSGDLEKLCRALYDIEPTNIKVLEGMIGVFKATGNESEVIGLSARLKSLSKVSARNQPEPVARKAEPEILELDILSELPEDDIEIELDIDDADSELSTVEALGDVFDNNDWLASVGDLFDTITIAPSGVRYGSEMDSSDAQSHFDLGLAFKEMGLYDEAINEFRKASSDSVRRVACLIMQGACLRERGEFDIAINMLKKLLKPGLSLGDSCAVKYELVLTYEACGKTDEANRLLNEINSESTDFRDVSSRLNTANFDNPLDFSDEDLKNF